MPINIERENLLTEYLTEYSPVNRMNFINQVLNKYIFERYKLRDNNIKFEDMIITDNHIRNIALQISNNGECSEEDFINVFNMLEIEQIEYIGF
jgi:hypothetical protein